MSGAARDLLYLLAAGGFIVGLRFLGSPRTARTGNRLAGAGMLLAVVVTLIDAEILSWYVVVAGLATGAVIGTLAAIRVEMTAMPQLVAAFNGFGGAASALVASAEFLREREATLAPEIIITMVASVAIGAVTTSGSLVAFAKLQGMLPGRPIAMKGHRAVNLGLGLVIVALGVTAAATQADWAFWALAGSTLVWGVSGVFPIGGADMPVVIALLNSLSGLAAAATGFVISNSALIIGGALVGAAGLILTRLMTEAMNRTLTGVLAGGFGGGTGSVGEDGDRSVTTTTPDDVAIALAYASRVVIVPGYGLAVAQAQHGVAQLTRELTARGVEVRFGIHPVAGRMPGHMNVLLAEADIPYELMLDLEETNPILPTTDVVVVLGANDVVNPTAKDDPTSPIHGMPILEVDEARTVVVIKRSLSPGFAGIDNPLFYRPGTLMLFDDARAAVDSIVSSMEMV